MTPKRADVISFIWWVVFAAAIGCGAYSQSVLSAPVPIWAAFNLENSELPDDRVLTLAIGVEGSLWAGTLDGGLARLDKDGHWQTYSKASTNGGLPDDGVAALALGADGSLWAGTLGGGLARLDKDGHWQTYSKASTNGGLPDDNVTALVLGVDGSLWAGIFRGGLARLDKDGHWPSKPR
jgi:ligand-binding sensor domain-containing protein